MLIVTGSSMMYEKIILATNKLLRYIYKSKNFRPCPPPPFLILKIEKREKKLTGKMYHSHFVKFDQIHSEF